MTPPKNAIKTPHELMAECVEQLSADGHYELSNMLWEQIEALKATQSVGEIVAWGVFGMVGDDFILQYPVSDTRSGAESHAAMYSANQVLEIRPLYTQLAPSTPKAAS
jgi:hypothetical protein